MLDVGDPPVQVANDLGSIERRADVAVHRPGRVDVAHPVVAVRVDAEVGEEVDEDLGVVAGIRGVAVRHLVRDVRKRDAHVAIDGIRGQQGLGIHRIEVVDAVQECRLVTGGSQGPGDHVEDHRPAQAPDVDRPRGCLGVVDDLWPRDARGQLVRPVHLLAAPCGGWESGRCCRQLPAAGSPPAAIEA